MRACFLGQNVCALGFGVATLQMPKLEDLPGTPLTTNTAGDRPTAWQDGRGKSFLPLPAGPSVSQPAP